MSFILSVDNTNTAINSGGYVIVPERAVDGAGRNAIYVYMTANPATGSAWKISGGLNGGFLVGFAIGLAMSLLIAALIAAIVTLGLVLLTVLIAILLVLTIYLAFVYFADMKLQCYEVGRAIGSIVGGFSNFFVAGFKTTMGLIGMLLGVYWNGYNLDKSNGTIGDNQASC